MTSVNVVIDNRPVEAQFYSPDTREARAKALQAADAAAAAAVSEAAAESVVGPTYESTSAGLAATAEGGSFAVDNGDGTVSIYREVSGAAVLQRSLLTTAAAAADTGAEKIGTATGDDLQTELDRGGRVRGPGSSTPDRRSTQSKVQEIVAVNDFRKASHDSDWDAIEDAQAYLATKSGGILRYPDASYDTHKSIFGRSNIWHRGENTLITFDGVDPGTLTGSSSDPRWGNLRASVFAFAGENPADMASGVYSDNHTGDYPVASPLPFAADTVLKPGAKSLTVASSGDLTGVSAGSILQLQRGVLGWHYAYNEMIEVDAVSGTTVTLKRGVQNEYRNANTDAFNDFFEQFAYSGGPPPGVDSGDFDDWLQCGWRLVDPVRDAKISGFRLLNVNNYPGYANSAVWATRAFGVAFDDITLLGGALFVTDCEKVRSRGLVTDRMSSSYPDTAVLAGNGSNDVEFLDLDIRTGSLVLEEGASRIRCTGRVTNAIVQVQKFCRLVYLRGLDSISPAGFGIIFDLAGHSEWSGRLIGAQPALWIKHKTMNKEHPSATLAHVKSLANEYFDGTNIHVAGPSFLESTANNSLEIYSHQEISVDAPVDLGGTFGSSTNIATSTAQRHVGRGNIRRVLDGTAQGVAIVTAKPTFFPARGDQIAKDTSNDRIWQVVNQSVKTAASVDDNDTFTINSPDANGGLKAGDVVRCWIQNTSTVTIDGTDYALGTARDWHDSVVTSQSGGVVELATGVPNNWEIVTGSDGEIRCARWG